MGIDDKIEKKLPLSEIHGLVLPRKSTIPNLSPVTTLP